MSHAMHRLPPAPNSKARVLPTCEGGARHGWAQRSNSLASAALVLSAALACGSANSANTTAQPRGEASPAATADERFGAAVRLYESGHWEQAFRDLSALADLGHAPAAKLALLMLRYGSALYGTTFSTTPGQVARWAQRVLRATSRATASPRSITAIA